MQRLPIATAKRSVGGTVRICGFIETVRKHKRMEFLVVGDRSGRIQVAREIPAEEATGTVHVRTCAPGDAVDITGRVVANSTVALDGLELVPDSIAVAGPAQHGLPINEMSGREALLDWRYLALREPRNRLVFEIATAVEHAMRMHWHEQDFLELHSPKLMHSASESGAETFSLEYFHLGHAYLAQSPQFYKQMAIAAGFERVFEIGPVFRAEASFTSRHATEFTSVDVELAWIESHEDVMAWEERWIAFVLQQLHGQYAEAVQREFNTAIRVPSLPFPRLTMEEAHRVLSQRKYVMAANTRRGDIDPGGLHELAQYVEETYGSEFYFLTGYPGSLRPFYHMRSSEEPHLTNSFDLMWKGIEITTGAQREHRYAVLQEQAKKAGLSHSVQYYLDFFKYGCPPHGGFGLGFARFVMCLLQLDNIREATFLFRGPRRLTP